MKKYFVLKIAMVILFYSGCTEDKVYVEDESGLQETLNGKKHSGSLKIDRIDVLKVTDNSATINWYSSTPRGNASIYHNIYLGSSPIALGLIDEKFYKIDSLQPTTSYKGYIEVTDSISVPYIAEFSFETKKSFAKNNRLYFINGFSPAGHITKTRHGRFLLAGSVSMRDEGELLLSELDSLGYEVWRYIFPESFVGDYQSIGAFELSGGGYLFYSEKLIARFSSQGSVIGEHLFESRDKYGSGGVRVQVVVETSNNTLLVLGSEEDKTPFILKLGVDGNHIWKKSGAIESVNCITPLNDGTYAVLGGTSEGYGLIIIDDNGNVIKSHDLSDGSTNFYQKVIQTSDGGYAVLSNRWDIRNYPSIRVIKLSKSGTIAWDRLYAWGSYGSNGYDIIENREGQLIIVGSNEFRYDCEALIAVLNSDNSVEKTIEFSPDYMDYRWLFQYIIQTDDGGYFLKGGKGAVWSYYGKELGLWLLKTDDEFNYMN